jgi:hypothetical protein
MNMDWNVVITITGTSAVWIAIGIWIFNNLDIISKWISIISGLFSGVWHKAEQTHVASDIQSHLDHFKKELGNEASDALPYGIKVNWVAETTREAFIEKDNIVVRISAVQNNSERMNSGSRLS